MFNPTPSIPADDATIAEEGRRIRAANLPTDFEGALDEDDDISNPAGL